jgi:hypothetical protein
MVEVGQVRRIAFLLTVLLLAGIAPAWAEPAGSITVAAFREFLVAMEEKYDERAARAVAVFFADAALTQGSLWSDCLREQSVLELRTWIREAAPPELTLQQALRLNAKEHGCEPRDQADTDADLAIQAGHRH